MAARIVVVAHAATSATRRGAFPRHEGIERPADVEPVPFTGSRCLSGPELRCRQTAAALGWSADVVDDLADLDAGRWAGAELVELAVREPDAVRAWMTDPTVAPHGGESIADLAARVGDVVTGQEWPDGRSMLVVAPLVVGAITVHLLGAPVSLAFAIDIAPLSATVLTGHAGRWRLRELSPWGRWGH